MTGFDVLNPAIDVHQNLFIEAQAGTGKTFALQHLIVRLLISNKPLSLSRILVVTFTRAATRDLKRRVRETLVELIQEFQQESSHIPYVQELIFQGRAKECMHRLRLALSCFEEAKIDTIHSFCFQILQENAFEVGLSFFDRSEQSHPEALKECVKDLFRSPLGLTTKQLSKLFKGGTTIGELTERLLGQIQSRTPILLKPTMEETSVTILKKRRELIEKYTPQAIERALVELAPCFEKCADRSLNIKSEVTSSIQDFLEGGDLTDSLLSRFHISNTLKRAKSEILEKYTDFLTDLSDLIKWIELLSDELRIFAHVAEKGRERLSKVIQEKELLYFEDLILKIHEQLPNADFTNRVREAFDAVLIDEFQDTNLIQWEIFSTCFLSQFSGSLILVGDPKQAIYRFRQADIYTYLKARESFPPDQRVELVRNYRSEPALIDALNALFSQKKPLLTLPKTAKEIYYTSILYDETKVNTCWKDGKGSLIVLEANDEIELLKHSLCEVLRLHQQEGIALREFAFLVKDRYQGVRLLQLCEKLLIPTQMKGQRSLVLEPVFDYFELFLKAALYPQIEERIKRLLGTPIFNYALQEIPDVLEKALEFFYRGHLLLKESGLFPLFTFWKKRYGERLIAHNEVLFSDFEQLFETFSNQKIPLALLISSLEKYRTAPFEEKGLLAKQRIAQDAIQIMTIHVSKGLEFDIVFPVGLALAPPIKRELVYSEEAKAYLLDEQLLALHHQELECERIRQLYVALTRPKKRLYLPLITQVATSPIAKFLEGLDISSFDRISSLDEPVACSLQKSGLNNLVFERLDLPQFPSKCVESFTSLSFSSEGLIRLNPPQFPAGAEVGILLHSLLEQIPLGKSMKWAIGEMQQFATPLLKGTLLEGYEKKVAEVLAQAWHTILPNIGISISQLDPKKIMRELPFEYPTQRGMMKGFIDVVFEYNNRFYLIDWKSNHLDSYSYEAMKEECEHHHYALQASIYRQAVQKYLKQFDFAYEVESVFYCFLRGMEGSEGVLCL